MTRHITIVGGGYIGAKLAKSLDAKAEVTLIEPRSHFVHAPAMIRRCSTGRSSLMTGS